MSSSIKVLLIDDDDDDREIFRYALKSVPRQIDFEFAPCGKDALAMLERADTLPHYIFVDLNMPGMNGIQCLQAIKKVAAWGHIPIIVYSGIGNQTYEQQVKDLNASHYLIKPFRTEELTHVLSDLLSGCKLPFLLPAEVNA